ncbi:MAG TPA: YceI family protein [Acidimicrobiales bacterium]|nr:YceI family protein [Acidimicrobiales bacterium]
MTRLRRFGLAQIAVLAFVVIGAVALLTKDQWDWLLADDEAQTTGVLAPTIDDVDSEVEDLYRISADDGSSVTYRVEEDLAGRSQTTEGVTSVLGGDIAVNTEDPSASRIGTIVVNVEMFESDSSLRDKRIRHDFLESTHYPFASFEASSVEGIPAAADDGASGDLTITGDLTVKETTAPVTFTGEVTLVGDELRATVSATVLMSTYDVGPINIAGLAHTSDEVELTFDLVARRVDAGSGPDTAIDALPVAAAIGDGEFVSTVMPILESNCASCHTDGGSGWNTVELATAGDAAAIADDIALVTQARYMPPWPASDVGVALKHDYSMSDEDIQAIVDWAADGGGLDVASDTPLEADDPIFDPIERDIETKPAEPYVGSVDRPDDYRCVISEIPDPEGDGTWVKSYSFEPDKEEITHHSIITAVAPSSRAAIEEMDEAEDGSGFTCYGQIGAMPGINASGFGGWTPGQQPRTFPPGSGMFLESGTFLVNQIHYHYDHETPPDQSVIVIDTFTAEEIEAQEAKGEPLLRLRGNTLINPAEGPCTPEEEGPLCDRDAVLDDIAAKYGAFARVIPDGLIGLCGGTLDDYDDLDGTVFSTTCDHRARVSGTFESVLPHMHEFGASYRMTLNPDTPDEVILVDIPTWSFEWQLYYEPVDEIRIEPDDVIRVTCTWDRALQHMEEPRYITWSDGTVDEMCFSPVRVIPDRD